MNNLIPSLKYAWTTIKHKYFVFRAGLRLNVPIWQIIVHDWSKFTLAEMPHYGRQFFGAADDPDGFNRAWLHHQNFSPHHWEFWIPRTTHYAGSIVENEPMEMPEKYLREMLADWMGANRGYECEWPETLSTWEWFDTSFGGLNLHDDTRTAALKILWEELGLMDQESYNKHIAEPARMRVIVNDALGKILSIAEDEQT